MNYYEKEVMMQLLEELAATFGEMCRQYDTGLLSDAQIEAERSRLFERLWMELVKTYVGPTNEVIMYLMVQAAFLIIWKQTANRAVPEQEELLELNRMANAIAREGLGLDMDDKKVIQIRNEMSRLVATYG